MLLSEEAKYIVANEFRKAFKATQEVWACAGRMEQHLPGVATANLTDTLEALVAGDVDVADMSNDQILDYIAEHCELDDEEEEDPDEDA